ncbi:hypothetical protein N7522_002792 [Penicillium canescens]|nr:hypothetical protein N7522_002792 [Penicillium canescens]
MGTIIHASDIPEVDLLFPRNETYAPTDRFPVVFAFQNSKLARYLNPQISYILWNNKNVTFSETHDLRGTNWTAQDTYFAYNFVDLSKNEGHYAVTWTVTWVICDEKAFENELPGAKMMYNSSTWGTGFTTQSSASKPDLVAATANKTCPGEYGVLINVTDKTMKVPRDVVWSDGDYTNRTCAVLAKSTPTSTPQPCRVHIDNTTVASMEASYSARLCNGLNPPSDCPVHKKSAAQPLAMAGMSCLLATFGALGFFLV